MIKLSVFIVGSAPHVHIPVLQDYHDQHDYMHSLRMSMNASQYATRIISSYNKLNHAVLSSKREWPLQRILHFQSAVGLTLTSRDGFTTHTQPRLRLTSFFSASITAFPDPSVTIVLCSSLCTPRSPFSANASFPCAGRNLFFTVSIIFPNQ